MTTQAKEYLAGLGLWMLLLFIVATFIAGVWPQEWPPCLISGIDYNGKSEQFGLFC